ncbi:MAG: hypothetical protein ACPLRR_07575 [Candidatus Saccharicenans sp.]
MSLKKSLATIKQADLQERQKLSEWEEELWTGLMEKIARGKILVPGKSRSGLRGWRKLAPAAALVGLILISFLSYRLIDHFWPRLLTRPTANQNLPGASQSGEKLNPVGRELEPEKEATIKARDTGFAPPERQVEPTPPSKVEVAKTQTPPSEKMVGNRTSIVSGEGEKAVPPVPTESGHQPAPQPERIEMAFILPETGVQILWILDRNFNLEGVKK